MFSFSSAMLILQRLDGAKHTARKTPLPCGKISSNMQLKSEERVKNQTVFCVFCFFLLQFLKWNWQLEAKKDHQRRNHQRRNLQRDVLQCAKYRGVFWGPDPPINPWDPQHLRGALNIRTFTHWCINTYFGWIRHHLLVTLVSMSNKRTGWNPESHCCCSPIAINCSHFLPLPLKSLQDCR